MPHNVETLPAPETALTASTSKRPRSESDLSDDQVQHGKRYAGWQPPGLATSQRPGRPSAYQAYYGDHEAGPSSYTVESRREGSQGRLPFATSSVKRARDDPNIYASSDRPMTAPSSTSTFPRFSQPSYLPLPSAWSPYQADTRGSPSDSMPPPRFAPSRSAFDRRHMPSSYASTPAGLPMNRATYMGQTSGTARSPTILHHRYQRPLSSSGPRLPPLTEVMPQDERGFPPLEQTYPSERLFTSVAEVRHDPADTSRATPGSIHALLNPTEAVSEHTNQAQPLYHSEQQSTTETVAVSEAPNEAELRSPYG